MKIIEELIEKIKKLRHILTIQEYCHMQKNIGLELYALV